VSFATRFSFDDLVALLRRTTDRDGFLDPILADPDGFAILGAAVEMFVRVSAAGGYDCDEAFISSAAGGGGGTSSATVSRPASGTSGTIPRGYTFVDPRGVVLFVQTDVPVASGALSVLLPLETLRHTEAVNTDDDQALSVAPTANVVLDSLGTTAIVAPAGDPSIVSTTFQVVGDVGPIVGGASDWLSVLGRERSVVRQVGEDTESYRARVRDIPDAVSPKAIGRAVQAAVSRVGLFPFLVLEPFDDGASAAVKDPLGLSSFAAMCFDAGGGTTSSDYCDELPFVREMVSRREATAYFRVSPQAYGIPIPEDAMLFCDDGFCDDPILGFIGDGTLDPRILSGFLAVQQDVDAKRAAGVAFDVYAVEDLSYSGVGDSASAADTSVFSLVPASGGSWVWIDAEFGHDFHLSPPLTSFPPAGVSHSVRVTFDDATTFETPQFGDIWSERLSLRRMLDLGMPPSKPIVKVEGMLTSDGTIHPNLVGWVRVVELSP
jgi:hypothetical protein